MQKKPFVWEPECCPCARARGGALSPGDGAYSPTDDHRRHDYDGDYDDEDDDYDYDDEDDNDDVDSCCKTLSSAAKRTFGFC